MAPARIFIPTYFCLFLIQDTPDVCFDDRVWRKYTTELFSLKIKININPDILEELVDFLGTKINPEQGGDVCFRRYIKA